VIRPCRETRRMLLAVHTHGHLHGRERARKDLSDVAGQLSSESVHALHLAVPVDLWRSVIPGTGPRDVDVNRLWIRLAEGASAPRPRQRAPPEGPEERFIKVDGRYMRLAGGRVSPEGTFNCPRVPGATAGAQSPAASQSTGPKRSCHRRVR
jgi:hypothetical protein